MHRSPDQPAASSAGPAVATQSAEAHEHEKPADVGVVFVHGIGSQVPGQTLHQFGEPLYRWLFRWLGDGRDPNGREENPHVQMTGMILHPDSSTEPARCHVRLRPPKQTGKEQLLIGDHQVAEDLAGNEEVEDWLLAESCWSDVFTPPAFSRLAFWLITYAPWLALDFMRQVFVRARRRQERSFRKLVTVPFVLLVGPIVGVVAVVAIAAVLVLSRIPWKATQNLAGSVARGLARSIGDAYIVVGSPMNHGAMTQRIRRDLAWVAERSQRLVVVAHSQGAALVHQILRDEKTRPRVDLFLSVGSAVRRIEEFAQLRETKKRWQLSGIMGMVAGLWLLGAIWALTVWLLGGHLQGWLRTTYWSVWLVAGAALVILLLWGAYELVAHTLHIPRYKLLLPTGQEPLRWVDCYATADPVPNGKLYETMHLTPEDEKDEAMWQGRVDAYEDVRTYNQRWMLNDHVTYPDNMDQFVSTMATWIAKTSTFDLFKAKEAGRLEDATELRRRRTRILSLFRGGFIAAAGVMVWGVARAANTSQKASLGDIDRWVQTHLPGWVSSLLDTITNPFVSRVKGLGLSQPDLIGALVLAAILAVAYGLVGATWSSWDRRDTDRFFVDGAPKWSAPAILFIVVAVVAIGICLLLGLGRL